MSSPPIRALPTFRALGPSDEADIALVAARMRETLIEVVGQERGASMYSIEWLVDRVRFHLDPTRSTAAVYVAEIEGQVVGHTIVRVEEDTDEQGGLVSTTYVVRAQRRAGLARALLAQAESWMLARGLRRAATHTSSTNTKLIALYERAGYEIVLKKTVLNKTVLEKDEMVRLERELVSSHEP